MPKLIAAAPQLEVRLIVHSFWPCLLPFRRPLALLLLLLAVRPAVAVAEINLFRHVVDDVLVPADVQPLIALALLYIGLNLVSAAAVERFMVSGLTSGTTPCTGSSSAPSRCSRCSGSSRRSPCSSCRSCGTSPAASPAA